MRVAVLYKRRLQKVDQINATMRACHISQSNPVLQRFEWNMKSMEGVSFRDADHLGRKFRCKPRQTGKTWESQRSIDMAF